MCIELIHKCNYCGKDYACDKSDIECPTINYDKDKNICDSCRKKFERKWVLRDKE